MDVNEQEGNKIANLEAFIKENFDTSAGSLRGIEKSLLSHLMLLVRPKTVVEIGTFRGATAEFLCNTLAANEISGKVFSFDFQEMIDEALRQRPGLVRYQNNKMLEFVPGASPDSLALCLRNSGIKIDLALVDADHSYSAVRPELELIFEALSPNGYIFVHDYGLANEGTVYAVEHFLASHKHARGLPFISDKSITKDSNKPLVSSSVLIRRAPYPLRRQKSFWYRSKYLLALARSRSSLFAQLFLFFKRLIQ